MRYNKASAITGRYHGRMTPQHKAPLGENEVMQAGSADGFSCTPQARLISDLHFF
jgi:hypothetical protein